MKLKIAICDDEQKQIEYLLGVVVDWAGKNRHIAEIKLLPVLDRAVGNLSYRQRAVLLPSPDGDVKISLADICYAESENVHVAVHTVNGVYRSRITLAKFALQLDETFIKVHRSYIVGLKYVKKITRTDITMLNGDIVPISRGMYDEAHAALIKFL